MALSAFRFMKIILLILFLPGFVFAAERPNIVWITSEDNGPYLGCYGDSVARTPVLDALAKRSARYLNCFSNAAVCSPARQTLISGMYSSSLGGQHMRSKVVFPEGVPYFPNYLREAGYYTTNNSKTDYNGGPADKDALKAAWNDSSRKGHWRNRPQQDTPFFAVFNIGDSHESNLFPKRWENRKLVTDPKAVRLPKYLPDLPELRRDFARYYDCLEVMDQKVGKILNQLEADGLSDNTIVFYFSDHGGSMPRGKSFTYDSGTRVPLLVHIPEKWKRFRPGESGASTDQLVSFVDFAPTVLSLLGIEIPNFMQGRAFLGSARGDRRNFVHTFRGRRGERYDLVRGVRSKDFLYLRNYSPHLPVMQLNGYSYEIPGYDAWRSLWKAGRCTPLQAQWYLPKASEELYRVSDDPENVRNLAGNPEFAEALKKHRDENDRHILAVRDSVFFPEGMSGRKFAAYQKNESYPLTELIALGSAVSDRDPKNLPIFQRAMESGHPCIRYWGVTGCVVLGKKARELKASLVTLLGDGEPVIVLQAARALAGMGEWEVALPIVRAFLENAQSEELSLQAALAVDECNLLKVDPKLRESLKQAEGSYTKRVVGHLIR